MLFRDWLHIIHRWVFATPMNGIQFDLPPFGAAEIQIYCSETDCIPWYKYNQVGSSLYGWQAKVTSKQHIWRHGHAN